MREELPVLHIYEHDNDEPLQTEQSANSLFKYVNQADYLYSMLKNKAVIPRYPYAATQPYPCTAISIKCDSSICVFEANVALS